MSASPNTQNMMTNTENYKIIQQNPQISLKSKLTLPQLTRKQFLEQLQELPKRLSINQMKINYLQTNLPWDLGIFHIYQLVKFFQVLSQNQYDSISNQTKFKISQGLQFPQNQSQKTRLIVQQLIDAEFLADNGYINKKQRISIIDHRLFCQTLIRLRPHQFSIGKILYQDQRLTQIQRALYSLTETQYVSLQKLQYLISEQLSNNYYNINTDNNNNMNEEQLYFVQDDDEQFFDQQRKHNKGKDTFQESKKIHKQQKQSLKTKLKNKRKQLTKQQKSIENLNSVNQAYKQQQINLQTIQDIKNQLNETNKAQRQLKQKPIKKNPKIKPNKLKPKRKQKRVTQQAKKPKKYEVSKKLSANTYMSMNKDTQQQFIQMREMYIDSQDFLDQQLILDDLKSDLSSQGQNLHTFQAQQQQSLNSQELEAQFIKKQRSRVFQSVMNSKLKKGIVLFKNRANTNLNQTRTNQSQAQQIYNKFRRQWVENKRKKRTCNTPFNPASKYIKFKTLKSKSVNR